MELGLDRVSLQLRGVRALLTLDPKRARMAFEAIVLELTPLPCATNLVYHVSLYYRTLRDVLNRGFTPEEVKDGDQLAFLGLHLSGLQSASQVKSIGELIETLAAMPSLFEQEITRFSQELRNLQSDDRSFSADTRADIESIVKLAKKASQYQISIGIIATALREYLVRHARGARCRDSLENPRTINAGSLAGINAALREMSGGAVEPITANEITPSNQKWRALFRISRIGDLPRPGASFHSSGSCVLDPAAGVHRHLLIASPLSGRQNNGVFCWS